MEHQRPDQVESFYDRFAVDYLLRDFRLVNLRQREVIRLCRKYIRKGSRILEIGCGAGVISRALQQLGSDVVSFDISSSNILVASTYADKPNGQFRRLDVTEIMPGGLGATFDAVLLADVIEHIPLSKHAQLFQTLESALAPDGQVILTFPTPEYQQHLHDHQRELLQAVDEVVTLRHLLCVTSLQPVYFSYKNIFGVNQYAHLVLARAPRYRAVKRSVGNKLLLRGRSVLWNARNFLFLRRLERRLRLNAKA